MSRRNSNTIEQNLSSMMDCSHRICDQILNERDGMLKLIAEELGKLQDLRDKYVYWLSQCVVKDVRYKEMDKQKKAVDKLIEQARLLKQKAKEL
jgi:hypothetical protein